MNDHYVYPGTHILINKLGIKDDHLLQDMEIKLVDLRIKEGLPQGQFDYPHLQALHHHLFQDLYDWAGKERTVRIAKGETQFAFPEYIKKETDKLFGQLKSENLFKNPDKKTFVKTAAFYFGELNAIHPFREGNGRTNRIFFNQLAEDAGYNLAWFKTNYREFIDASIDSFKGNYTAMESVFNAVTIPLEKETSLEKTAITLSKTSELESTIG